MNWRSGPQSTGGIDSLRERKVVLALVGVAVLVALAGCSSLTGASGPSVSDAEVVMSDDGPVIAFNYSVDDYSTVLLEGPNGQVLLSGEVSPEKTRTGFPLTEIRGGEYTIALQQGGETKTTKTLTFDGPDAEIQRVKGNWSGNQLNAVTVVVRNTGDVPAHVKNVSAEMQGESETLPYARTWVPSGETREVTVESEYVTDWTVDSGGTVETSVSVETGNETLTASTSKKFEPASLRISDVNQTWDGNTLTSVRFEVENTGDIPAEVHGAVIKNGETASETTVARIGPHQKGSFRLNGGSFRDVFTASSGGNISYDVAAISEKTTSRKTLTHEVEKASVQVQSLQPDWNGGVLQSLQFTAKNPGEVKTTIDAAAYVNGEEVSTGTAELGPGSEQTFYMTDATFTPPSGGEYELSLELSGDGWSTSASSTKSFNGVDGEVSKISPLFIGNYGENTSDLSSIEVRLKNNGDIPMTYDAIRYEISGTSNTVSIDTAYPVSPSDEALEYVQPGITVSDGSHELTIEVLDGGEVVASETKTVSTGS